MNWGELFGGLAMLSVGGWLVALVVAAILRGGSEGAAMGADFAGNVVFGGGGLLLMIVVGLRLVADAF